MNDALRIIGGIGVCLVGAYGYVYDLNYWGFWVLAGVIIIAGKSLD